MKRLLVLLALIPICLIGWSQELNIHFRNGQEVKFDAKNIEFVEFTEKANNVSVNFGDAVDLGLSVKWASCNVGATSPEEFGDKHAWGELNHRGTYFQPQYYLYYDTDNDCYISIGKDIGGTDFDAAHVKWGGKWRMPTYEELKELKDKCNWEWTKLSDVNGFLVSSSNGNSIFFPCGSSTIYIWASGEYNQSHADAIAFGHGIQYSNYCCDKWSGGYVRPVMPY